MLVVCIIFLSEYRGLEYKVLEEVRQAVGDESGESIHGSDYCRVVDLEFFFCNPGKYIICCNLLHTYMCTKHTKTCKN